MNPQPKQHLQSKSRRSSSPLHFLARAITVLVLAGAAGTGFAQVNIITLTNSDALGTSSFTDGFGATNWDSGLPPVSGGGVVSNAYFTSTNTLRTPGGAGNYTFAGDSLTVTNGSVLSLKGSGIITVSNLTISGGKIVNNGTGGSPDTGMLAGNITVAGNSTLDGGATNGATALNVLAPMTGPGGITIADNGAVLFSTNNTYAGNTTVSTNSTLKIGAANAIPNGPGNGFLTLNGGTPSGAVLDLNGFDATANDLTSGGGAVPAQIINSVAGTTNTITVDCEFSTGKTYKGYIKDNNGSGGAVALTVIGSTFWTVVSNLTYSGDTTINGGRVLMGASNILPWGPGRGNLNINDTGILDMQGRSEQVNGLSGNGTIDNYAGNGSGLGGHSTLHFGSNDVSSTFSGVIQNRYFAPSIPNNDYVQIMKWGLGTVTLTGNNTFNGAVTINSGVLQISQSAGLGAVPKIGSISISSSTGDAGLYLLGTNGDITLDPGLTFLTAGTNGAIVSVAGNNTINGSIYLNTGRGTTIRADGDTLTLAGSISIQSNATSRTLTLAGSANGTVTGVVSDWMGSLNSTTNLSLAKSGTGTWILSANNTYSGATTIALGTLTLAASGSISNTPAITLQDGATFNVAAAGGWGLGASQTLGGSGNVAGNVTADGTVAPGTASSIGALVFSNQLSLANATVLKLNRTNTPANADLITAATLVRGGALVVTNIGDALQGGDSFTLFSAAAKSGSFTVTTLPALSSGLAWTNTVATDGKLTVVSTGPAARPGITSVGLAGTNLIFSGTNGTAGQSYTVLASTNVALPFSSWTPIATNTFTGTSFSITNALNPNLSKSFFILRVP